MTSGSGWRTRDRGERTRDELIRAGIDVLLEQGWTRLTVRGVAARAGVAPSLVCHHFGGIAVLQRVVVEEMVHDMLRPALQVMTAETSWPAGVVAVLRHVADEAVLDHHEQTGEFDDLLGYGTPGPTSRHVLADVVVASMQDAVVREVVQESLSLAREQVVGWLDGLGVPEQHLDGAAVLLVALLDGLLLHHQVDPALPLGRAAAAVGAASGSAHDRAAA